jgi:hypothetical protein
MALTIGELIARAGAHSRVFWENRRLALGDLIVYIVFPVS